MTLNSVMAKAYGLMNSGAAGFQIFPAYNDDAHCMDRCLFRNGNENAFRCKHLPLSCITTIVLNLPRHARDQRNKKMFETKRAAGGPQVYLHEQLRRANDWRGVSQLELERAAMVWPQYDQRGRPDHNPGTLEPALLLAIYL